MKKKIVENISYAVLSNFFVLLISAVLSLFVPKLLGVREYGYWQLYSLYLSYVGFFHFGWVDGIYLKLGGKEYKEIDSKLYSAQLIVFLIFECVIMGVVGFGGGFSQTVYEKKVIMAATALCGITVLLYTYLITIMQATNRIKESALLNLMIRFIYLGIAVAMLFANHKNYLALIAADLISRVIVLGITAFKCKDLIGFRELLPSKDVFLEIQGNIKIGINLMFANISSMLVTGIVRMTIEQKWGIEAFANVSIAFTLSNLVLTFMSAIATTLFPILRRIQETKLAEIYFYIRNIIIPVLVIILISFYPLKLIMSLWLPQYTAGLRYLALVFPMVIFEGKSTLLLTTYLNTIRKERYILKANILTLIITCILSAISVGIVENLALAVVILTLLLAVKSTFLELYLRKVMLIHVWKDLIVEYIIALAFILISWNLDNWFSFILYGCVIILYLVIKRKDVGKAVVGMKKIMA